MRLILIILLLFDNLNFFGQENYNKIVRQKLIPTYIDTLNERVFVYIKPNARIYFRNADILKFIDSLLNKDLNDYYSKLIDTLKSEHQKIEILDLDYSYDEVQRNRIIVEDKITANCQQINESFEFIGADLILKGKFMVYSIKKKRIILDKLKAVKSKGLYGTEYLDFILPDKQQFYSIVTVFGE